LRLKAASVCSAISRRQTSCRPPGKLPYHVAEPLASGPITQPELDEFGQTSNKLCLKWNKLGCAALNAMPNRAIPSAANSDAPPSVLVVEDEVLLRLAIADYLRECGLHVFEACDVIEAKVILASNVGVDVVFSDVQLPGAEDGFALARWVREHHASVQVIMTSGWVAASDKARDLCHSGTVVQKPYEHEAVLQRIQALVRKARRAGA
jgi:CheY-like chemotaxis protein